MDRIEPYIGMPIILGDCDAQMSGSAESGMQMQEQTMQMQSEMPQAHTAAQTGESSQNHQPAPPVQQHQACLNDQNCEICPQPPQQTMMPGMAYVPWQIWQQPYDYEKGFEVGTIFPDLDFPFLGYQGGRKK